MIILSISWVIDQLQGSKSFKRNPFELILMKFIKIWSIMTILLFYLAFCSGCRQRGQKYHLSIFSNTHSKIWVMLWNEYIITTSIISIKAIYQALEMHQSWVFEEKKTSDIFVLFVDSRNKMQGKTTQSSWYSRFRYISQN